MFDETRSLYPMMVPFFYESGCHDAFFKMGEVLVQGDSDRSFLCVNSWMLIVQRLITVDVMLNSTSRTRNERPPIRAGFDLKKYVAVCQRVSGGVRSSVYFPGCLAEFECHLRGRHWPAREGGRQRS